MFAIGDLLFVYQFVNDAHAQVNNIPAEMVLRACVCVCVCVH